MQENREWFSDWFDSPYYHILYKDRDLDEAKLFIDNLVSHFRFRPDDKILDLGCGKGRFAIYLYKLCFQVTGLDLSENNIRFAQRFSQIFGDGKLRFYVHDMRKPYHESGYNYILNMFTSFGYFENDQENQDAISSASAALVEGGKFILDFFNTARVIENLVKKQEKEISGIKFQIEKELKNDFVLKHIRFSDQGNEYDFTEKVKAITENQFRGYFENAGLKIVDCFGDYNLRPFDSQTSDRMIFVGEKI
jgi:cyclopropane fatty-acyl-phospholipid synthase-like methyltransferase